MPENNDRSRIPIDELENLETALEGEIGHRPSSADLERIVSSLQTIIPTLANSNGDGDIRALHGQLFPNNRLMGAPTSDYWRIGKEDITFLRMCENQNFSSISTLFLGGALGALPGALGAIGWFFSLVPPPSQSATLGVAAAHVTNLSMFQNGVTICVFVACLVTGITLSLFNWKKKQTVSDKLDEIEKRQVVYDPSPEGPSTEKS